MKKRGCNTASSGIAFAVPTHDQPPTHTCTHTHTQTHRHTHTRTHKHTNAHTQTHTDTHTQVLIVTHRVHRPRFLVVRAVVGVVVAVTLVTGTANYETRATHTKRQRNKIGDTVFMFECRAVGQSQIAGRHHRDHLHSHQRRRQQRRRRRRRQRRRRRRGRHDNDDDNAPALADVLDRSVDEPYRHGLEQGSLLAPIFVIAERRLRERVLKPLTNQRSIVVTISGNRTTGRMRAHERTYLRVLRLRLGRELSESACKRR